MMKITLLGDSIRQICYGKYVPELLGDGFEVYQPGDNCRYTKYTMRGISSEWLADMEGSEIVHWNNGIWDTVPFLGDGEPFEPLDGYVENVMRIARFLLARYGKVIFATTTPIKETNEDAKARNLRIAEYNAAVLPKLRELGVVINDLYSLVRENMEEYLEGIHLNDVGSLACAKQVAACIKEVAAQKN